MTDDGMTLEQMADELARLGREVADLQRECERAEEARRESEQRFHNIFTDGPHGIVIVGLDRRFKSVNQAFCHMLGYPAEELLSRSFLDITHPDFVQRDLELTRRLYTGEIAYFKVDKQYVRKDGGLCDGCVTATAIRDQAGTPLYFLSMIEDITERRHSEVALRESERRQADIIQFLPDATMAIDDAGQVVSWNRAMEEMTGVKAGDILGKGGHAYAIPLTGVRRPMLVDVALHPELAREWNYSPLEHEGGFLWRTEYRADLAGRPAYLAATATALRDSSGLVAGAIESIRNVTGQRMAEMERTSLEDQLRQSQKMEAIGRLAGGVAHDFNNLLTSIIGNVSLALVDLEPQDPLQVLLNDVKQAADSATGLTRQLLAFSRKQMIEPRVIDLNELLRNLRKMLSRLIGEDIELMTRLAPQLGCVRADHGQLEQVLFNLAVNARDAMPDGGRLTIETANVTLGPLGDQVRLTVSDTGCGMSEDVKVRCFEPFFTTKPNETGTGLGLATVYGVVKQAGGSIELFSQPGQGTTFKLYLPRVLEPAQPPVGPRSIPAMPMGTETILLVEDEPMVHQLAVRILRRLGYQVLHCLNATEALLAAEHHAGKIELLMTDIVLPGMNGRVLAEQLGALRPDTKVLFTSGYAEDVMAHHGVREPGIQFLAKPYTVQTLAWKIREVLEQT